MWRVVSYGNLSTSVYSFLRNAARNTGKQFRMRGTLAGALSGKNSNWFYSKNIHKLRYISYLWYLKRNMSTCACVYVCVCVCVCLIVAAHQCTQRGNKNEEWKSTSISYNTFTDNSKSASCKYECKVAALICIRLAS